MCARSAIGAALATFYAERMCGIAGLYTEDRRRCATQLGEHLARMLEQLSVPRARQRRRRVLSRSGAGRVEQGLAALAGDRPALGRARRRARASVRQTPRRRACAPPTPCSWSAPTPSEVQAWLAEHHPELTLMSAGRTIEIYKEAGLPSDFVRRFALDEIAGSHALGHTRMATESRVTTEHSHPFSTGLDLCLVHNGSLSNHNRLRRTLAARGDPLPDRQRHRGRGRLPDLAAARGRDARAGARGLPGRSRRLLHVRGRHRRRLRGAARPDRLQAGGDGRDRRVGRDGVRVPGDRGAPGARGRDDVGARARARSTAGAPRRWRDGGARRDRRRGLGFDLAATSGPRAEPAPARARAARTGAWSCNPGGKHSIAVGLDAPVRGRDRRATSATTAPA